MLYLKQFLIAFILIPLIDYVWLAKIMKSIYIREFSEIGRIENGQFVPLMLPAVGVYVALALGIVVFTLNKAEQPLWQTALLGATLGFVIYGVYDFTNLSTLKNYSVLITVIDICWGAFLCGTVATITSWLTFSQTNQ